MADERVPGPEPQPSEGPREVLHEWPAWLILVALWAGSLWLGAHLPARVPMHWNIRGEVDRWGGPWEAALLIPALATGIYLFILALDRGRPDFKAARGMTAATRRQVRVLLLTGTLHGVIMLPLCLLPEPLAVVLFLSVAGVLILVPVIYAYRVRAAVNIG